MIYTDLKIVTSDDLSKRSYITFYFKGKRIREYNGNSLSLNIKPNKAKTIEERRRLLKKLEFELQKALDADNYPHNKEFVKEVIYVKKGTLELLDEALQKKLSSNICKYYKRNIISIYKSFTSFLTHNELKNNITSLKRTRIEEFLTQFNTSGTYYMNKRRDLGVLLSTIEKSTELNLSYLKDTDARKSNAKLHKIYSQDQIKSILLYLKDNHYNLYLCCLISYGCFLRPHQEVRSLCKYHFKKNLTEIHLSGNENKGRRVRVVYIPPYVKKELELILPLLENNDNIFTRCNDFFNDAYFNTAWTRAWKKMYLIGLIEKNQTIYSFRHTAAVNVYHKTKDLNIIQQLLGHSDMIVTLKYLRGLGEVMMEDLKDALPEL